MWYWFGTGGATRALVTWPKPRPARLGGSGAGLRVPASGRRGFGAQSRLEEADAGGLGRSPI